MNERTKQFFDWISDKVTSEPQNMAMAWQAALQSPPVKELEAQNEQLRARVAQLEGAQINARAKILRVIHACDNWGGWSGTRQNCSAAVELLSQHGINASDWLAKHDAAKDARIAELEAELSDTDRLCDKMSDILTRTANALKGEPDELTMHSWHDLPEIAAEQRAKAVPDGYRLVPIEPTVEMLGYIFGTSSRIARSNYRAMLAAAPQPKE